MWVGAAFEHEVVGVTTLGVQRVMVSDPRAVCVDRRFLWMPRATSLKRCEISPGALEDQAAHGSVKRHLARSRI